MTTNPPPPSRDRALGKGLGALYTGPRDDEHQEEPAADEVAALLHALRSVNVPAALAQAAALMLEDAAAGREFTEARRAAAATVAGQLRAAVRPAS